MKNVFRIIFVSISILLFASFFQNTQNYVMWKSDTKIGWEDFQDSVPLNHEFDAWTVSGINYRYHYDSHSATATIHSFFDRNESWSVKEKQTARILDHEQRHFDITEIFARKFRKSIFAWNKKTAFDKFIKSCFDSIMNLRKKEEVLYDDETKHSKDAKGQASWNAKIDSLLSAYSEFSSADVEVLRK